MTDIVDRIDALFAEYTFGPDIGFALRDARDEIIALRLELHATKEIAASALDTPSAESE